MSSMDKMCLQHSHCTIDNGVCPYCLNDNLIALIQSGQLELLSNESIDMIPSTDSNSVPIMSSSSSSSTASTSSVYMSPLTKSTPSSEAATSSPSPKHSYISSSNSCEISHMTSPNRPYPTYLIQFPVYSPSRNPVNTSQDPFRLNINIPTSGDCNGHGNCIAKLNKSNRYHSARSNFSHLSSKQSTQKPCNICGDNVASSISIKKSTYDPSSKEQAISNRDAVYNSLSASLLQPEQFHRAVPYPSSNHHISNRDSVYAGLSALPEQFPYQYSEQCHLQPGRYSWSKPRSSFSTNYGNLTLWKTRDDTFLHSEPNMFAPSIGPMQACQYNPEMFMNQIYHLQRSKSHHNSGRSTLKKVQSKLFKLFRRKRNDSKINVDHQNLQNYASAPRNWTSADPEYYALPQFHDHNEQNLDQLPQYHDQYNGQNHQLPQYHHDMVSSSDQAEHSNQTEFLTMLPSSNALEEHLRRRMNSGL